APFLYGLFVLPAVAWLALVGLAVPAAFIERLGYRAAIRRGFELARADYIHAAGSLATLVIVAFLTSTVLFFLLRGASQVGRAAQREAADAERVLGRRVPQLAQLRRAAAAGVVAAVALAGCGGSNPREIRATLASPRGCVVHVFFASRMVTGRTATRNEVRAVGDRIASSSKVKTFAFVSRELGFKRMARHHPELTQGLHANPLPETFEIVPRSGDDARALAAELGSERGVEHVGMARAC